MNLGDKIKEYRKKLNLTQEQLSIKLGISKHTFSKYEQNQRKPNIEMLQSIAEILNVTINDLVEDESIIYKDRLNRSKYLLEQYTHSLGYEFIFDEEDAYLILHTKEGDYEIEMKDLDKLHSCTHSFINFQLHEIIKRSRKIGE